MASNSPSATFGSAAQAKPSFAKIAASGLKPLQEHQDNSKNVPDRTHTSQACIKDSAINTLLRKGQDATSHIDALPSTFVQAAYQNGDKKSAGAADKPQVHIQTVGATPQRSLVQNSDGLLLPASDDIGTQVSSSSSSIKPQSLDDGKSMTSGATFALDEKESLRPDDSASVKAVEDEDLFSPGLANSRMGSDIGVRAFRDQLAEISSMEPQRNLLHPDLPYTAPKGVLYVPPQGPGIGSVPSAVRSLPVSPVQLEIMPDPKLLEALDSPKDRVWVLKLEQDVLDFVKDPSEPSLELPQCNSFYRMLAHKMADYYMLGHGLDDSSSAVRLYKTPNCRIPPKLTGITAPSTAASTPPPSAPQMKILRRGDLHGAGGAASSMLSENGNLNDDDKKAKPVSREEREARYEAARLRIMGSARPSDSPEAPKDKQDSRSSSTTGKKGKKKQRPESDDDFEARSAYSNYFASPSYAQDGLISTPYGFSDFTNTGNNQFAGGVYGQQVTNGNTAQVQGQLQDANAWAPQSFNQPDATHAWAQTQSPVYDISNDFQRSMSLQNPTSQQNFTPNFNQVYGSQYYPQQNWPQPQFQMQSQSPAANFGPVPATPSTPNYMQEVQQPYAFGQLPSQAFPGRLPNKLEHPLPGSYKSRHFNPQSQSFVPGHSNGMAARPFTPQGVQATTAFPPPYSPRLQRQSSTQSHASAYGPSHASTSPGNSASRPHSQQLTHPLPQRVPPRQPSPGIALPPKPSPLTPQRPNEYLSFYPSAQQQSQVSNQNMLAMYGAPASLPAKPPPSAESFDSTKLTPLRPSFANNPAIAARQPNVGFPGMSSLAHPVPGHVVNASGNVNRG